jgi:hypothetical protein
MKSLLCNSFPTVEWFFIIACVPAVNPVHECCLPSRKTLPTDGRTDRQRRAVNVFFAHARAGRTLDNCSVLFKAQTYVRDVRSYGVSIVVIPKRRW